LVQAIGQHADGSVYAFIEKFGAKTVDHWFDLRRGHRFGRSWQSADFMPAGFGPYVGGFTYFAFGRSAGLAAGWMSDTGTDYARSRIFVSHDGSRWRRIQRGRMPKIIQGLAIIRHGTLLIDAGAGRLWRLRAGGTTPNLVRDAPRATGGLQASLGLAIAVTGKRSIAVSRDGRHWRHAVLGESLATASP
jgi:hypothetical protein